MESYKKIIIVPLLLLTIISSMIAYTLSRTSFMTQDSNQIFNFVSLLQLSPVELIAVYWLYLVRFISVRSNSYAHSQGINMHSSQFSHNQSSFLGIVLFISFTSLVLNVLGLVPLLQLTELKNIEQKFQLIIQVIPVILTCSLFIRFITLA